MVNASNMACSGGSPGDDLGFTGSEPTKEERFVLVVGNRSVCQGEMGDPDHGSQVWNLSGDLCGSLVMKDSERG